MINKEIKEGLMPFLNHHTWYRVVNEKGKKTPLLLIHGGPGSTHNYFESFDDFAFYIHRPIIMYDQFGCGNSTIENESNCINLSNLFNKETWLNELKSLISYLNLKEVHILGQSWGGMLALIYALENPGEVKSFILSSTLSSTQLWKEEQLIRINRMDKVHKDAIFNALGNNTFLSKEYIEALDVFMEKYCASKVNEKSPEYLKREKKSGKESYLVAWGPNEFTPTGNLKDFDITDKLHRIKIPCLITSGQYDLSSPHISKVLFDNIPNSAWHLFRKSRHMPFIDEMEEYYNVLNMWLNKIES